MDSPQHSSVRYEEVEPHLRTGDIVLFHGASRRSHVIETATGSEFSHIGMIVRIKADQPPRLWHTDPRPVSEDLADEEKHGGAQLNDLVEALARMTSREYGDTPFLRQLNVKRTPALEAGAQRAIATANHVSFPSLKTILKDWILGHLSIATSEKRMECAEVVAFTFQQMGLLPRQPPANAYSPRDFSAQHMKLPLLLGATLDRQVELVWSGQRNE